MSILTRKKFFVQIRGKWVTLKGATKKEAYLGSMSPCAHYMAKLLPNFERLRSIQRTSTGRSISEGGIWHILQWRQSTRWQYGIIRIHQCRDKKSWKNTERGWISNITIATRRCEIGVGGNRLVLSVEEKWIRWKGIAIRDHQQMRKSGQFPFYKSRNVGALSLDYNMSC
jgi:hypothetical protein